MRNSVKTKPTNKWVISAQLDEATYNKLERLREETNLSRSKLIKIMIAGASIRNTHAISGTQREATEDDNT